MSTITPVVAGTSDPSPFLGSMSQTAPLCRVFQYLFSRLKNLKRVREIHRARNPGEVTSFQRIGRFPAYKVFFLFLQRRGLIRNRTVGRVHNHAESCGSLETSRVVLDIPIRRVSDLPDALQVGMAVTG